MNEIIYSKTYTEYHLEVGTELSKASESFVKIGYLLKVARDTEVLNGSDYEGDYLKFAEEEFGLDKSQVSRFIRINDRFSVGGNSDTLLPEYSGYGTRKLGIMIMLPDELTEELSPDYTVEEINEIKEVIKEEQEITPVEAMVERMGNPEAEEVPLIDSCIHQILENNPDIFVDIAKDSTRTYKILAPISEQMYIVKVQGVGKIMVTFHEESVTLFNARTKDKETVSKESVERVTIGLMAFYSNPNTPEEGWEQMFGKEFPKNEEPKKELRKVSRVKNETKLAAEKVPSKKQKGRTAEDRTDRADDSKGIDTVEEASGTVENTSGEDNGTEGAAERTEEASENLISVEDIRKAVLNFYHYSYLDNILHFLDEENVQSALNYLKTDIKRLNDVKNLMEQYKPSEE